MAKTTGMRMAKASMAEADMAVRLANMLGELEKGYFPWVDDGTSDPEDDPLFFDENDPEHLKLFYERVTALLEPHPGGLFRVAFGYATILSNDVLDPEDDCLALNPKFLNDFQSRVQPWLLECFGAIIAGDREERNHRFLEEALELVQSLGCTASEAHQLVDYVYGRPSGEPSQEVGGVMVTLAALCLANEIDMHGAGETELSRIWTKVEQIRAKQAAKPKHSPLPC